MLYFEFNFIRMEVFDHNIRYLGPYFTTLAKCLPRSLDIRFDLRFLTDVKLPHDEPEDQQHMIKYRAEAIRTLTNAFLPLLPGATKLPTANSVFVSRELAAAELFQTRKRAITDAVPAAIKRKYRCKEPWYDIWDKRDDDAEEDQALSEKPLDDDSEDEEKDRRWDSEAEVDKRIQLWTRWGQTRAVARFCFFVSFSRL